ncbi:MAG: DndE family protein [Sulfurovum sp.]
MRTTQEIENYIPKLNQLLGLKNEPKWITLRFIINISLSFDSDIEFDRDISFDGKLYNLEQITGFGKEIDNYTDLYWSMIEVFDDITIKNKKEFDIKLEYHLLRGYKILSSSVKHNSNLFEFLLQEFYLD